jgi:hypothetical protein
VTNQSVVLHDISDKDDAVELPPIDDYLYHHINELSRVSPCDSRCFIEKLIKYRSSNYSPFSNFMKDLLHSYMKT